LHRLGASLVAQVGKDQTVFTATVRQDHADTLAEILTNLFLDFSSEPGVFEALKREASTKLDKIRRADLEELGKNHLENLLYLNHPYNHPPIGTRQGIDASTMEAAQAHQKAVFCSKRVTLATAGRVSANTQIKLAAFFSNLNDQTCRAPSDLPQTPSRELGQVSLVQNDGAVATAISLGTTWEVNRSHPDFPALLLAASFLGQHRQFNGVLMQEVRVKRGLNYGTYAYAESFSQDGDSRFPLANTSRREQKFSIWLRPVETCNAHFSLELVRHLLRQVVEKGLSQNDFEKTRTFAKNYYPLYLQSQSRRLGFALDDAFYGLNKPFIQRLHQSWDSLSAQDVHNALKKHLNPEALQIAIITPEAEKLAASLKSAVVKAPNYAFKVSKSITETDELVIAGAAAHPLHEIKVVPLQELF
jgi:zinc protease